MAAIPTNTIEIRGGCYTRTFNLNTSGNTFSHEQLPLDGTEEEGLWSICWALSTLTVISVSRNQIHRLQPSTTPEPVVNKVEKGEQSTAQLPRFECISALTDERLNEEKEREREREKDKKRNKGSSNGGGK